MAHRSRHSVYLFRSARFVTTGSIQARDFWWLFVNKFYLFVVVAVEQGAMLAQGFNAQSIRRLDSEEKRCCSRVEYSHP